MDFKQVIIVRRDINMGTGKIAAQVAHAAVMGAEKVKTSRREWFKAWFAAGQAKVVVKETEPRSYTYRWYKCRIVV